MDRLHFRLRLDHLLVLVALLLLQLGKVVERAVAIYLQTRPVVYAQPRLPFAFQNEFELEFFGAWEPFHQGVVVRNEVDGVAEVVVHDGGHLLLLEDGAVDFEGEYHGVWRVLEGVLVESLDDGLEGDFGGHGVAVVDDGGVVGAVPAVELDALAPLLDGVDVALDAAFAGELVGHEVGVVGGVDVVVGHGLGHVVHELHVVDGVGFAEQVGGELLEVHEVLVLVQGRGRGVGVEQLV